jgi:hypothetical protein
MSDDERAYEVNGELVVPWRITDPLAGYVPRIGDAVIEHEPYAHVGEVIELQTPESFAALPDGTVLISIQGEEKVKGRDDIDLDTRFGRIAWGVPDRRTNPR